MFGRFVAAMRRCWTRPTPDTHLFLQLTPVPWLRPADNIPGLPEDKRLAMLAWVEEELEDFAKWAKVKAVMDIVRGSSAVFLVLWSREAPSRKENPGLAEFVVSVEFLCASQGREARLQGQKFVRRCRWVWLLARLSETV